VATQKENLNVDGSASVKQQAPPVGPRRILLPEKKAAVFLISDRKKTYLIFLRRMKLGQKIST